MISAWILSNHKKKKGLHLPSNAWSRSILEACRVDSQGSWRGKFLVQWETPPEKTEVEMYRGRHLMAVSGLHTLVHRWAHAQRFTCSLLHYRDVSPPCIVTGMERKAEIISMAVLSVGHVIKGRKTGHLVTNHNECSECYQSVSYMEFSLHLWILEAQVDAGFNWSLLITASDYG